jgi:hypothetical protein
MKLNKLNQNSAFNFLRGFADLKKYVFINLRKQIRQKMEGISASQF